MEPIPDEIRILCLYGVEYYIPWEDLHPGGSFFLRTTATARMVQTELGRAEKALNLTLRAVNRVEFGYYGVRVWRL